jgi:hypothetical protein
MDRYLEDKMKESGTYRKRYVRILSFFSKGTIGHGSLSTVSFDLILGLELKRD